MNIFESEKLSMTEEIIEILAENKDVKIERIISAGQTTDWMSDTRKEFVILVQGRATIQFENGKVDMSEGDTLLIEARRWHKVSYTSRDPHCIWICIYF